MIFSPTRKVCIKIDFMEGGNEVSRYCDLIDILKLNIKLPMEIVTDMYTVADMCSLKELNPADINHYGKFVENIRTILSKFKKSSSTYPT